MTPPAPRRRRPHWPSREALWTTRAAARFVAGTLRGRIRRPFDPGLSQPADLYLPDGPPRGTLVFVHGMSMLGRRDVRQMAVCSALADAGYRVVAPELPEVTALQVTLASVDQLVSALREIAAELSPGVGMMAPSFSGALALRAAADAGGMVTATCTLGTFCDAEEGLRWALEEEEVDEYARLILFRDHLHWVCGDRPALQAALGEVLADDSLNRTRKLGPAAIAALAPEDRDLVRGLRSDPALRMELAAGILPHLRPLTAALTVPNFADRVPGGVAIVHGRHDNVIPASQARSLDRALRDAGVPTRLCITPLLGHGEHSVGPRDAARVAEFVSTLAWFFGRIPG